MNELKVEQLESFYKKPIIGVIGATSPNKEYDPNMGINVGYMLRENVDKNSGSIFTGGVSGVGVDIYSGIIKYCLEKAIKTGKLRDDKFFVLVPTHAMIKGDFEFRNHNQMMKYTPPYEYEVLARLNSTSQLTVVRAGKDLEERRKYVAKVADKIVVVNGGYGTLDEALSAVKNGKQVISLVSSGGCAALLKRIKEDKLSKKEDVPIMELLETYDLGGCLPLIECVESISDITKFL